MSTQQYAGLQILRYVAAMLVAALHITQAISIHITGQGPSHYWAAGTAGVDIFFVISGFVMTVSTRGLPDRGPARLGAAWTFMKRRILRIVPVYWFYTLLKAALLLAVPALATQASIDPAHLAASLLFIPAMSPWGFVQPTMPVGWTLNFEMLFYAVFALGIALGAPRIRFCLLVFLSLFLAGQTFPQSVPLAFYAQSIIFEFILGVCIAQILMRYGPFPAAGIVSALAGALFVFGWAWDDGNVRLLHAGLGAAAIVLGFVWFEPLLARSKLARKLSFLGDASYSIYLSHTFVVPASVAALAKLGVHDTVLIALVAGALVTAAGCASYVWLEKPMMAFFKRFLFRSSPLRRPNAANTPAK
jgi:exopolysaccharide production protein ExoZ